MNKSLLYLVIGISSILAACGGEKKTLHEMLPRAGGRLGEVVVVMPDDQWKGPAGQAIRDAFYASYYLLPQHEPHFKLNHRNHSDFMLYFKEHRNILSVLIEDHIDNQVASTNAIKDRYAKNQTIMEVRATTTGNFLEEFQPKSSLVIDYFHKAEMDRVVLADKAKPNPDARKILADKFGIDMVIPSQYAEVVSDSTFSYFKQAWDEKNADLDKAILVYTYPYVTEEAFGIEELMRRREEFTSEYIHGTRPGTYMTTEYFYEPILDTLDVNGRFTARVRGLWKMEGDFLGGPFASYSFVDDANENVITVEAYVFAPHEDKRDHMRSSEALLTTAKSIK